MNAPADVLRREFLRTAAATGLAVPYLVSSSALAGPDKPGANERLSIALIGCGGMGRGNLSACGSQPDVVVTGACDVWQQRREAVIAQYPSAKPYADYRELLQRKDLDGVIIATPPHWHCLMAVDACRAGKDIYVQKPMTLHLAESLAVRNAVRKHQRVCQVGTQIHAGANYRRVVELIRSGSLGKLSVARTFNVMNQGPQGLGNVPDGAPPAGLDWERWVGPYPMRPFNPLIVQDAYTHCSFMTYSGGWTPGMAPHIIDLPVWAMELGFPITTYSSGGRYTIHDAGDAPDTQEVLWQYPGFTLTWSMSTVNSFAFDFGRGQPQRRLGIYFHGVNGTVYADYGMFQVVPEGDRMKKPSPPAATIPPSPGHEREWLDAIKTRKAPSCCPEYHCRVDVPLVLANLSLRLGRSVRFDPAAETIVGDAEASRLAQPEYRSPWKFPEEYVRA
jgi:predicted dehydrogenase